MEYRDYHDDGQVFREASRSFGIELSNGWTVWGDGKIFCNLDDIENTSSFECRISSINDSEDNDIPDSELDGEIGDEFNRKFENCMQDFAGNPSRGRF